MVLLGLQFYCALCALSGEWIKQRFWSPVMYSKCPGYYVEARKWGSFIDLRELVFQPDSLWYAMVLMLM